MKTKTITKLLIFFILLFLSSPKNILSMNMMDDELIALLAHLLQEKEKAEAPLDPEVLAKLEAEKKEFEEKSKFVLDKFNDHIQKYHFLVFPTCENLFYNMTPKDLSSSLQKIIDTIAYKPWVYLEQTFKPIAKSLKKENLEEWKKVEYNLEYLVKLLEKPKLRNFLKNGAGYWEFIGDQLVFYHEFIKVAKVDLSTNKIFLEDNFWIDDKFFALPYEKKGPNKKRKTKSLKDYWNDSGETVHYDLYALAFKFWCNLFLEEISNNNLQDSYRFYDDLEEILENLEGSSYEADLREYIEKYKDIQRVLRQEKTTNSLVDNDAEISEMLEFYDI